MSFGLAKAVSLFEVASTLDCYGIDNMLAMLKSPLSSADLQAAAQHLAIQPQGGMKNC